MEKTTDCDEGQLSTLRTEQSFLFENYLLWKSRFRPITANGNSVLTGIQWCYKACYRKMPLCRVENRRWNSVVIRNLGVKSGRLEKKFNLQSWFLRSFLWFDLGDFQHFWRKLDSIKHYTDSHFVRAMSQQFHLLAIGWSTDHWKSKAFPSEIWESHWRFYLVGSSSNKPDVASPLKLRLYFPKHLKKFDRDRNDRLTEINEWYENWKRRKSSQYINSCNWNSDNNFSA